MLLALLSLLSIGIPGEAGDRDGGGTPGVRVTMEVPFASESLDAVKAATLSRKTRFYGNRAIPRKRIDLVPASGPFDTSAATSLQTFSISAPAVTPRAPVLDSSFGGLENPAHGDRDVIPPDTMGAAGPNHLVSLLNSEFGVFSKTGSKLDNVSLRSFWASLGTDPGEPADFPFDPKVLYDQHSGRFAAVTLGGTSAGNSWVMIAVSASENPLGTWHKWAIPSSPDNTVWADYPGFGIDAYNLYVTANMFNNIGYQYSKIWVIPKNLLLGGAATISWTPFTTFACSSLQPAYIFGTPGVEYYLCEGGTDQLLLGRIENITGTPVFPSPTPVAVARYTRSFSLPGAPQAGDSRTIDTSDTRLLNTVYRNLRLWATHHVLSTVNGIARTEIAWYQIDPGTNTVSAQGRITDTPVSGTARWYYYPSIAVNGSDVAALGFSGSSAIEYAGGYYTILRPSPQPPFYVSEPVTLLKSGDASYYKILSRQDNRWGDFSATVVDPVDDAFWTLQEYAMTPDPVSLTSRWGTWWGKFRPSDVAAPSGLTATATTLPQVVLNWIDNSGNETGFKVERRRLPGEDYIPVITLSPNVTTFTDNASTGLLGGLTYSYRVLAFNANGGSYSGEVFASIPSPIPNPALTSLSPSSATAGNPGFTLTVAGTGFASDSVVRWNGSNRTTTYLSGTQLTAAIPASDIALAGLNSVTVYNPSPNGVTSNGLTFTVVAPSPPPPPSGGGGGGCLAMAPSSGARADVSSILHVAFLFLPAAVYGWRRRLRPGKR